MPGDLESGGRDVCMLERQDRDLYWGLDFRREGGGVVCVHKWRIDRETMLMSFKIGLCMETQGKRVIVCVIGTS